MIFGPWVSIPGSVSRFCLRFDFRYLGVNYLLPGVDLRPLGSQFGPLVVNYRPLGVVWAVGFDFFASGSSPV